MIRWLKKPDKPDISKYIDCYWFLEKSANAEGTDYPKLNPDPSTHLILAIPTQSFQYKNDKGVSQVVGNHWLHPYSKTYQLDHSKAFACIGIKFHAGAPYSLINLTALQGQASQTLIDKVYGSSGDETIIEDGTHLSSSELIVMARNAPDNCCKMLDTLCVYWFSNAIEDKHSQLTRQILPLLATSTSISDLASGLFCSQRTLERSFLKVTGLTLKQCQSMQRLESILEFLYQRQQSEIDWVDIAYQFGFSDQPHLIRYLKKHMGLTPQDYALQRGFTIDEYGGVE